MSQRPLMEGREGDAPLPAHFLMQGIGEKSDESCPGGCEVHYRHHAYTLWALLDTNADAGAKELAVRLRHLRDQYYVLQLSCESGDCGVPDANHPLYAILRIDSDHGFSFGTIAPEESDAKWGVLSGGDKFRGLMVTRMDQVMGLMRAHLDQDRKITWTQVRMVVLPADSPAMQEGYWELGKGALMLLLGLILGGGMMALWGRGRRPRVEG